MYAFETFPVKRFIDECMFVTDSFVVWRVAFSSPARILGECLTIHSLPALFFFKVQISSRTLIQLFMPGSIHSGSASWDDCVSVCHERKKTPLLPVMRARYMPRNKMWNNKSFNCHSTTPPPPPQKHMEGFASKSTVLLYTFLVTTSVFLSKLPDKIVYINAYIT